MSRVASALWIAAAVLAVAGCGRGLGSGSTPAPTSPAPTAPTTGGGQSGGTSGPPVGVVVPGGTSPTGNGASGTTTGGTTGGGTTTGSARGATLASVDSSGNPASADAIAVPGALATGGIAVAFESAAADLAGSTGAARQVYLRDLSQSVTELVSVTPSATLASGDSFGAVSSSEGRFVAFASAAPDLAGGSNVATSVYLRDRLAGRTQLASLGLNGALADGASADVAMSADGSRVAFSSVADNLVVGDRNGRRDVFVFDARIASVSRVSVTASGAELSGESAFPAVSPDGRFVAFVSRAPELVRGSILDALGGDVYLRDLSTGVVTLVSGTAAGDTGDASSGGAGLVGVAQLGSRVAFTTRARNLASGLPAGVSEVLVADATAGFLVASAASAGAPADGDSSGGSISVDGRFVAFVSLATNLDPLGQPPPGVYVHDLTTGRTARVDASAALGVVPDAASPPSISGDGAWVSWVARAGSAAATVPAGTTRPPTGVAEVYVAPSPLAP